jgi:hypothetical protein
MRRKLQTRKGGYKANNSWIIKPLGNANIQHITYSPYKNKGEIPAVVKNIVKPELHLAEKTNSPGNFNTIQSYASESIRSSSPVISPARTPISSTYNFKLPVRRESFKNTEIHPQKEIPLVIQYGVNEFENVPLGTLPIAVNMREGAVVPKPPVATENNYSYVKNQFGPYSQNKVKNSLKKRVKTFITGPPRNPYTKGPGPSAMRKSRKIRRSRK